VTQIKRLTALASIALTAHGHREQARSAEDQFRRRRNAKRLNDRINACERTFDRVLIKRITIEAPPAWARANVWRLPTAPSRVEFTTQFAAHRHTSAHVLNVP
jgi:hypothetical protein